MGKVYFLFFFLLIYSGWGSAQNKKITLSWKPPKLTGLASTTVKIPDFEGAQAVFENEQLLLMHQWPLNGAADASTGYEITNTVTEVISQGEIFGLNQSLLPNAPKPFFTVTRSRNQTFAFLKLFPIFKDANGTIRRITSFEIRQTTGQKTTSVNQNKSTGIKNSVLAQGRWFKFYVEETGVYRLDRSFLNSLGINTNNLDPATIKIYGQGGRMLPLNNGENFIDDIQENSIYVAGQDDGRFDANDYILFYGIAKEWNEESQTHNNLYEDRHAYFLTVDGGAGKRIQEAVQPTQPATVIRNSVDFYTFHEEDRENIVRVGRRWFGERFSIETEREFTFQIPGIDTSSPLNIGVKPASVASNPTGMEVLYNGSTISTFTFPLVPDGATFFATQDVFTSDGSARKRGLKVAQAPASGENISISLRYNNNGNPSAVGYLDYIFVEGKRFLRGGSHFLFTDKEAATSTGIAAYQVSNAAVVPFVWDVTDIYNITSYTNPGGANFEFKVSLGENRQFALVDENDFKKPIIDNTERQVKNQNLKGTLFNSLPGNRLDYLIVTPEIFLNQAQRLADFHQNYSGLSVKVVPLQLIYNEFSSGNQDIAAIRNLIRYIYQNAPSEESRIKYLCMFGDGSFDYKNRTPNNTNFAPLFHSFESFNLTFGVASDDFYTMMDPEEGLLEGNDLMDLAVGRIVANTPKQANDMVNKTIAYHEKASFGRWRNNFTLLSDDVDEIWEGIIQSNLDNLGNTLNQNKPFINVTKIHTDSYKQEVTSGGARYNEAKRDFVDAIEQGSLVVNYFGHGGEDGLADERIFQKPDILGLKNENRYTLCITATCEFTRFDNPLKETAGELMYWNPNGGAVALISTTRQIFVGNGITYNNVMSSYLFSFGSNEYTSVAEALRRSKNDPAFTGGAQKRVVFYIGDPALKLAIPKPNIVLTKINDVDVSQPVDTLKALSRVKLSGLVTDENNTPLSNYNGTLSVTVYDKNVNRRTLANDNTRDVNGQLIFLDFQTLGEVLYRGKATVVNGAFSVEFVVPKDVAIPVGNGRVSFYAENATALEDQSGFNLNILTGGINENAPEDNIGPEIKLFMNNETFVSGGTTNQSPLLLAFLSDENGINTASGIGHDIIAILDGNEANPIILNDYYESELDSFTKGKVAYQLRDLEPGLHTLTLRAWDVYNNSSTVEIQFLVLDDGELVLERVLNYPNPFTSYTEFWFNHNKPFEPLEVDVQVFTVSGKVVWTQSRTITGNGFSRDIVWDGRDNFGDKIGKGVYVYKITVKSTLTNKKVSKFEKLVIL